MREILKAKTQAMPQNHKTLRTRLEVEAEEIKEARLNSKDARAIVELDQNTQGRLSRMDALERQAMAEATDRRRALRLSQIEAAIQRMEEGEYGFCLDCGDEIAPERLDAEPCVLKCADCARG